MFGTTVRTVELPFANRARELEELNGAAQEGGLVVVYGRRRVGKTRLLTQWIRGSRGAYSQAIEAARAIQIDQVVRDLQTVFEFGIQPKDWIEFLELLRREAKSGILCLDEFPYLVASDPSLPSVLQRWLDHHRPQGFTLVLSGSSRGAMNTLFLNRAAPLYQRARRILHLEPMSFGAFCQACRLDPVAPESFDCYSLVGGTPRYWEFFTPGASAVDLANELYFGRSPFLEDEPARLLHDEHVTGLTPLSVLEAIGRGAEKASEIAARMETAQTNLSRVFQQLIDASLLTREIPFGESLRSTKKTRYRIQDPALRFWFRVFSPHRTRWQTCTNVERKKLIHDHAASVFEDICREQHPSAARYWEGDIEFDFVREEAGVAVVSEAKYANLSATQRRRIQAQLETAWQRSALQRRYRQVRFEVLDWTTLRSVGS